VAIVIAVVVFLMVGGIVAAVAIGISAGSNMSSSGDRTDTIPIVLNQPVSGELTGFRTNQVYELALGQATAVTISVNGDFDNYLELYRENESNPFIEDDDSGSGLNAQLSSVLQPGIYYILVRPFSSGTGHYTLSVMGAPGVGGGSHVPPAGGGPQLTLSTRPGLVSGTSGAAPVQAGNQCSVEIGPAGSDSVFNCRIRVTCGTQMIYGAGTSGYNHCVISTSAGAQVIEAHDTGVSTADGDPRMDIQTASGLITVSDGVGAGTWTVTVQLTPGGGTGPATSI
jgi:hypothetical protein